MSHHKASLSWKCKGPAYLKGQYSREHTWTFDGGLSVPGSSSPSVVPTPWSNPSGIDPEEAFVASIASCHLLTFLYVAGKAGFQVDSYADDAIGEMSKNDKGIPWVSLVTLHPRIVYGGEREPTDAEIEHLHHLAHEQCYIANSVKTEVRVSRETAVV